MLGWWRKFSHLGKFSSVVVAISGAIVGVAAAWPIVEWAIPAHRGYVLEHVGDVRTTTNELLLWKAEDTKNKIKSDREGWAIQIQKEQDPQTRNLIQNRIQQLDADHAQVDERRGVCGEPGERP